MRSMSLRIVIAFGLLLFPLSAVANNVTISGANAFAALDGGPDDEDHVVNGVFTVTGDLIVNGTISCNDSGGSSNACAMAFNVGHDLVINAGGALFAENRTGSGTGGAITISVGHNLVMHGASGTLAAAIISSSARHSSASTGGPITITVGAVTIESGATIDSGATNAAGGKVLILASGAMAIDGNVFSGPSRTLLSTRLTGQALDGGTANQRGGEIRIASSAFAQPAITIDSDANVISQGETNGSGPVTIEGCGVVVKGLVASLGTKDAPARVVIRSGRDLTIDGSDLGGVATVSGRGRVVGATTTSGRFGRVRADATTDNATHHSLDVFAAGAISVRGPAASSSLYTLSALPGVHDSKNDGGTIRIISTGDAVTASGNVIDDGFTASGDGGGNVQISAKNNVNLDTAVIEAEGDSKTSNSDRNGGAIAIRSYSGNVVWTNGVGDVTPTGSQVPTALQGSISITACGTINTTGSTFPTNGPPVGTFPSTTTGVCTPAVPSLPAGEPALPVCNNPPVANPSTVTTLEDTAVTITMTATDPDGNPVTFTIVTPPANGSLGPIFNPTPTSAQVVYTPAANFNGSDSFTFQADDGSGGTATAVVTINVTPVNDPPSFNAGPAETTHEDAGPQFFSPWASGISAGPANESSQHVTFTITSNSNPSLFSAGPSVTPSGALSYTSAPNAYGSATLTVVAQDDGGTANGGSDTSAAQTFTINVTAVNDAPSFTKGADVTVLEDSGAYSQAGWATAISAGPNEGSQTVTFVATNNNNGLFIAQPAVASNGTLTFTPAPNANGVATVTVVAHDDGGTANGGVDASAAQTFTVTVVAVNDPPSFTSGGNVTVLEDSGAYSQAWATSLSDGPNETGQALTFHVSNDNNALFGAQPAIASDGTLTFAPAANASGTATVTVTLQDDGGTANGGSDTSASQTFTITVTAVNDPPSFTKGSDQTSLEDSGPQSVAGWATAISAGPNESSQTVTFVVTNDNNSLFLTQPAVASNGTLTYTAAANANGVATVTVVAHDDGGTANGGIDTSAHQTFTITIIAVNDPPSFTKGADQTVLEDAGAQSVIHWATSISAGPTDESSQTVTFTTTNNNNSLFSVQPSVDASGTLTYTPAPDANGSAVVTVSAHDDGGTANGGVDASAPQTFNINVTAVNDAPSFTKGPDVSLLSDAGPQSFVNWATSISPGPANESAQLVSFIVTNDNTTVFTSQPAVSSSGTLTFTTAVAAPTTTVHVSVSAHDNGGIANGGVDTSAAQTFAINVTHANQPPVANNDAFDAVGNTELAVGTPGAQPASLAATGSVLANDSDPESDPLTATLGTVTAGASVTMNADGTFTYLPPAGFTGNDTFTYIVSDGHGHNVPATVTIHVNKRVLYVKNNGGGSTGRVDSPFATLAAAQAATANNDTVYVFTGDGTTLGQNAGFTLNHDGERLIGEGVALSVSGTYNGTTNPQLRAAGTAPSIANAAGVAVTVAKVGTLATAEISGIRVTSAGSHGVQITDATDVSMSSDAIASIGGSGVKGTKVVNFSLTNSTISGAGVSGVAFDDAVTSTENNLSGVVAITNDTITNPVQNGISIVNFAGTIPALTINGNGLTSSTSSVSSLGSAISVTANRGASAGAQINGGSISGNTITNFPSGAGIQIIGGNTVAGPAVAIATSASPLIIQDNIIIGASASAGVGTNGISTTIGHQSTGFFVIGSSGHPNTITNVRGDGVACGLFGTGTAKCTIAFNTIVAHNTAGSVGINTGATQAVAASDSGTLYLDIHDNNVSQTSGNGILATVRSVSSTGIFHIQNNTVARPTPASGTIYGIRVDSGNGLGSSSVCLKISGNTTAGSTNGTTTAPGIGLRVQHTGTTSTMQIDGLTPATATDGGPMEAYVGNSGQNPGSANGTFGINGVASISSGATYTASTCTIP